MVRKKRPFLSPLELFERTKGNPRYLPIIIPASSGLRLLCLNTAPNAKSGIVSRLRIMIIVPEVQLLLQGQIISVLKSEKHCNQCNRYYIQLHQRGGEGKMEKNGREKWVIRNRGRKCLFLMSLTSAFREQGGAGHRP